MPTPTPQEGQQKWLDRLSNAGPAISAGVDKVTEPPGAKAAAAADLWHRQVTASKDKFARKVGAVPLESWKNAMKTTGVARVAEGARQKQDKYGKFAQAFYPVAAEIRQTVKNMPKDGSTENAVARVRVAIQRAKQFGQTGS